MLKSFVSGQDFNALTVVAENAVANLWQNIMKKKADHNLSNLV